MNCVRLRLPGNARSRSGDAWIRPMRNTPVGWTSAVGVRSIPVGPDRDSPRGGVVHGRFGLSDGCDPRPHIGELTEELAEL